LNSETGDVNTKKERSKAEMTPPSLLISKSAATVFCCLFFNRQRQSFWLPIFESVAAL